MKTSPTVLIFPGILLITISLSTCKLKNNDYQTDKNQSKSSSKPINTSLDDLQDSLTYYFNNGIPNTFPAIVVNKMEMMEALQQSGNEKVLVTLAEDFEKRPILVLLSDSGTTPKLMLLSGSNRPICKPCPGLHCCPDTLSIKKYK